jgi:hypothetical protein
MTTHHEAAEQPSDKSVAHTDNGGSNPFQKQYQDIMHGASFLDKTVKDATQGLTHIDLSVPIHQAGQALSSMGNEAGKAVMQGMDKDPNLHYIKHDLCGDDPVKVGVAAAGALAVGGFAFALFAPEEAAAAAVAVGLNSADALPLASVGLISGVIGLGYSVSGKAAGTHK